MVCPRVGRRGGDHAAEQLAALVSLRHGALRERVLDVHPADELGEARELLWRDADVFEHGPRAELALRRGERSRFEARRGEGEDEAERDDDGCVPPREAWGQGPRGAKQGVEAGRLGSRSRWSRRAGERVK